MTLTSTAGQATRHYLSRGRASPPGEVDWSAAPAPHKTYPGARRVALPWPPDHHHDRPINRVSALLWDMTGLTRLVWSHPEDPLTGRGTGDPPGQLTCRPAPSGGALYPIEVYLATGEHASLPAGLYHYDPAHHCLDLLRDHDHRPALTGLLNTPPDVIPHLILALAPVWWRNAFKYGEFGYRLMCQETGVLTAQALAVAWPLGLRAIPHPHYADEPVNRLLGLETFRESVTALLTLSQSAGRAEDCTYQPRPALSYADLLAQPMATAADPPPSITTLLPVTAALHAASLHLGQPPRTAEDTGAGPSGTCTLSPPGDTRFRIPLPATEAPHLASGITRRASAPAGFHHQPISRDALAMILVAADRHHLADLRDAVHLYCLTLDVQDLPPGVFRYDPHDQTLLPVTGAEALEPAIAGMWAPMTRLALREAALALIPVADPETELDRHGDRRYRMLQIATGITVHRAALAAAALGLGARLHSDATTDTTDTALGLTATPWTSQTMLLIGTPRTSTLDRPTWPRR
ncbi:MAG TPA: SagB family peptide dehydrogenase [Pseudonocardiaceae bacterium]|nr:SagB family peptide dehydrogenase [Pseudonocardiaceae bacterium]